MSSTVWYIIEHEHFCGIEYPRHNRLPIFGLSDLQVNEFKLAIDQYPSSGHQVREMFATAESEENITCRKRNAMPVM